MDRKFLCTDYTGPETWSTPRDEWRDPATDSVGRILDDEDAAEKYCNLEWRDAGCDDDPTTGEREIAVEEPATGKRWLVTVTAEYVLEWTGYSEEVV